MTARATAAMIKRMRRVRQIGTPRLITIVGDPELARLKFIGQLAPLAMASNREAMVGGELFAALDGEPTAIFHKRMLGLAREKGKPWVFLGCPDNAVPPKGAPAYPGRPGAESLS